MTEIVIPEGVTTIGVAAFGSCINLNRVELPNSIENIQESAFGSCNSLSDVYYPKTQTEAESITFGTNNTAITSATWHFGETMHLWTDPVYNWATDYSTLTATRICTKHPEEIETETVDVSAKVNVSPSDTLEGAYSYVSSTFRNNAFERQTELIRTIPALGTLSVVKLPTQLTTIEAEAFTGLTCEAVILPFGCTMIGERAFSNCPDLIYVFVPNSVTSIADDAFDGSPLVILDKK